MKFRLVFGCLTILTIAWGIFSPAWAQTKRVKVSQQALDAVDRFQLAPGMKAALFAAEPFVANPVAFSIDSAGRVYVCETYRQEQGVEDNRDHEDWIADDLASQTVADRLALYKKHLADGIADYSKHQDRIRLLVDRNEDGLADLSTIFMEGFDDPLEGTGAGVLAWNGYVYYACIPKLWVFQDSDDDGKADKRGVLSDGYGVRVAFRGHDLHGLNVGPDGRLYFTIGDRGLNVDLGNRRIVCNETGAVLRCDLSGDNLEIVATGLRNPQDVAFDDYGNLFTCDNNADAGDKARWLHVVEGADYGWRMAFQYITRRSPWMTDRMWEPYHPDQPAFMLPPVANVADGPAGIAHYPGTGLPIAYRGNFFLCDFRGDAAFSGVRTFKMRNRGASFELIDPEVFLWNCLATDVNFAPDGSLYVSDWVEGWVGTNKGRIYRLWSEKQAESKPVAEVKKLLAVGVAKLNKKQLGRLLAHPDRRLRLEGQFELARRGDVETLAQFANTSKIQFAKFHAIWGLGQIGRSNSKLAKEALEELAPLMRDIDSDVRVTVAHVLGDCRYEPAADRLVAALTDDNVAVRREAALGLGRIGYRDAVLPLLDVLRENADNDPVLRHAAVMGLTSCATDAELAKLRQYDDRAIRMGCLLALRRRESPKVALFLRDPDARIAEEAARAIYDVPIVSGLEPLAEQLTTDGMTPAFYARATHAAYRLGTPASAESLAVFAIDSGKPVAARLQAIGLLESWTAPRDIDPLLGMWRPVDQSSRSEDQVVAAVEPRLAQLLGSDQDVRMRAARLCGKYQIAAAKEALQSILDDTPRSGKERAGAILALNELQPENLDSLIDAALLDDEPRVRAAARILLTKRRPDEATGELRKAIARGSQLEKQSAIFMLSEIGTKETDGLLMSVLRALNADKVYPAVRLDIVESARVRATQNDQVQSLLDKYLTSWPPDDSLGPYRDTLVGGDAERGRDIYQQRVSLQCTQCHMIEGVGGQVGPELTHIASSKSREELLESILEPNKTIAKGYETVILELDSGKTVAGILVSKTGDKVVLRTAQNELIQVDPATIEDSRRGNSTMPENLLDQLPPFDLRDLIEYLSQLK